MTRFTRKIKLMGSVFELIAVVESEIQADYYFNLAVNEIQRIENLLSEFKHDSDTSRINSASKEQSIEISKETYQLLTRCKNLHRMTFGFFDPTVKPLKSIYNFKNNEFTFPDKNLIHSVLPFIGMDLLILKSENVVSKKFDEVQISFAAIGKGYAADCVKNIWIKSGLSSGVISASGDLFAIGKNEFGLDWNIAIPDPNDKEKVLMYIPIHNNAVATSGNYEQFFLNNGVKYSHNIHPMTGLPCIHISSVSVFSPSAELSDALATAVYAMGIKDGLKFISGLPQTHVIIIDQNGKIYASNKVEMVNEAV
ncbi:MAG TPA: FAD:protein FMN transferase [Bacteroidia bacterium]